MEVETFQNPWELELLVALYRGMEPKRTLEIGAMYGGTLRYWLQDSKRVVVIDDEMRKVADWEEWASASGAEFHPLQGVSQNPHVVERAQQLGPYDFVFIDGDHTYQSVSDDWRNYSQMVADGGVIALHDILPRPTYGVWQLWDELKAEQGSRWMEICQNEVMPGNEGRCGVGLLWM